ncbi:conjugal transfer protein TraF [Chachezhania sediminis]|uniref:conjugal transfer protein TraF n=1 Tax=Chachezhania sediminis TaxID=2599291 RepID=UPI00131CE429|nr:conjugal transfer protein TraF [Chachezhania sediminis]
MTRIWITAMALVSIGVPGASATGLVCNGDHIKGWHFYCEPVPETAPEVHRPPPPETPTEAQAPPVPPTATERMMALRKEADELKHLAILEPTPAHIEAYMRMNARMAQMAATFAGGWQRVLYENPSLDANVSRPLTQMGQAIFQDQKNVRERLALKAAATDAGFLFVFEDPLACRLCLAQAQVLIAMEATYGIEVLAVSADGAAIEGFPDFVVDDGRLEELGLAELPRPLVALVEPATGAVQLLGGGLLTEDLILSRVYAVRETAFGEQYQ